MASCDFFLEPKIKRRISKGHDSTAIDDASLKALKTVSKNDYEKCTRALEETLAYISA